MEEFHKKEQYFFDNQTIHFLAHFLSQYERPCCLCAPSLGVELEKRGRNVTTLDIDERFSNLKGFTKYDLYRPEPLDIEFDIILCDPPFNIVSLSQLFKVLKVLSTGYDQEMVVSHLKRRSNDVVATFAPFNLQPTNYHPQYQIPQHPTNVEFFGNVSLW